MNNVEEIIDSLKDKVKYVNKFSKFDGITIEGEIFSTSDIDDAIIETKKVCNELKLIPFSIEKRRDFDNLFAVQFPEMIPVYTDEQIQKMYNDDFKFLLDNIKMKDPKLINKTYLLEQMDVIVKHSMKIVCRSVLNQYKEKYEDYYNNKKYKAKINSYYLEFLDEYLEN